jgi:flagellar L-ring protein FlgH
MNKDNQEKFWMQLQKRALVAACCSAMLAVSACGVDERLSRIGVPPPMTQIENPYNQRGYRPVSMPMPPVALSNSAPNSLWQPARQTFFKDQRANKVGDIVTVLIDINDQADLKNKTERTRSSEQSAGLPNFLGFESKLGKVLPDAVDPTNLIGTNSDSTSTGDGTLKREEDIQLKIAAVVSQVLPNGNFVIHGQQEVRVNFELRQLSIVGVIRPEDIFNNNSISYEKIAEARISYGGKGTLSDAQQPRYGDQFVDAVFPF